MDNSPSPTDNPPGMTPWGWLALLAVPGWLLWLAGLGYAAKKDCYEGLWDRGVIVGAPERAMCAASGPSWSAPFRGLRLGTQLGIAELWTAGTIASVLFAGCVVWLARRHDRHAANAT